MSSHFQSSHFGSAHFDSSHFGRAVIVFIQQGGSSDPAKIARKIAPRVKNQALRAKLLREDEEVLQVIIAIINGIEE